MVIAEPPIRSSILPNLGIVSLMKTTTIKVIVLTIKRFHPNPIKKTRNKQSIGNKLIKIFEKSKDFKCFKLHDCCYCNLIVDWF